MSQALYTAMGGINAGTTAISVVSNNVANINTTAFKAADTRFENLFSKTYTTGNSPTKTTGGVNPMQIGMGVQVGSIVRNFTEGSYVSTGRTDDLMISGGGYFTVMDAHGEIFLTRDGSFTLDSQGNMVTQSGFYVLGAEQLYNTSGSQSKINVPQSIKTEALGNEKLIEVLVNELNDSSITKGTFRIDLSGKSGTVSIPIELQDSEIMGNVGNLKDSINGQISAALAGTPYGSGDCNVSINTDGTIQFNTSQYQVLEPDKVSGYYQFNVPGQGMCSWSGTNGAALYKTSDLNNPIGVVNSGTTSAGDPFVTINEYTIGGTTTVKDIDCESSNHDHFSTLKFTAGTSNFLEATRLASTEQSETTGAYTSKVLDYTVKVEPVAALTDAVNLKSYSVANDGTIEATYSNGDKVTVEANKDDNTFQFKYTTATGVVIRGDKVDINPNIAKPQNLVLQMATVTNEAGLVSLNNNMWSVGPNTGQMVFAVGGSMGMGEIQNGGLEGSNVDLSRELSNMILAQRAIQANSRVFSTASSVMESLAYLGQ